MAWLEKVPWWLVGIGVLTLGLAPHLPEPHLWEKVKMLAAGTLRRPVDIADLAFHGLPWLIAGLKLARMGGGR